MWRLEFLATMADPRTWWYLPRLWTERQSGYGRCAWRLGGLWGGWRFFVLLCQWDDEYVAEHAADLAIGAAP